MLVILINENHKQVFKIKMFSFIFNLIPFIIPFSILYINVILTIYYINYPNIIEFHREELKIQCMHRNY